MSFAHHLKLNSEQLRGARLALLPGDPGRVPAIARHLEGAQELAFSREFRSWLGDLEGKPVLVISTGCGGPSLSVCVEELAQLGLRTFIRVGSCGSIQESISVGEVVISQAAVRLDGASRCFAPIEYPAVADLAVTHALVVAAQTRQIPYHVGITASTDTFYPGQERYSTYSGFVPAHLRGSIDEWRSLRVSNFEMEAATLLTMGATLGLGTGCVCGVVAQRVTGGENIAPADLFTRAEERAIEVALEAARQLPKA